MLRKGVGRRETDASKLVSLLDVLARDLFDDVTWQALKARLEGAMTRTQVARELGLAPSSIVYLIETGQLKQYDWGREWFVLREDVELVKAKRKAKAGGPAWVPEFLAAIAGGASVTDAAKRVGVRPQTLYRRRRKHAAFAAEWEAAAATARGNAVDKPHD